MWTTVHLVHLEHICWQGRRYLTSEFLVWRNSPSAEPTEKTHRKKLVGLAGQLQQQVCMPTPFGQRSACRAVQVVWPAILLMHENKLQLLWSALWTSRKGSVGVWSSENRKQQLMRHLKANGLEWSLTGSRRNRTPVSVCPVVPLDLRVAHLLLLAWSFFWKFLSIASFVSCILVPKPAKE